MMPEWEKAEMKRALEEKLGYPLEKVLELLESMKKVKNVEQQDSIKLRIIKILNEIGIPRHLRGCEYLRTAIELAYENNRISITRELYPRVAEEHNSTDKRVERAIRHAIEAALSRGNTELIYEYFEYSISKESGKPTNSEFIFTIADVLHIQDQKNSTLWKDF